MKTIGIIGGLSPYSTADYYLRITSQATTYLGNNNTLEVFIFSINPAEIIEAVHSQQWNRSSRILINAAKQLQRMGCDCVLIPCNTLHKVADEVQAAIDIPLLNIIEEVGKFIKRQDMSKVGLLGTKFTMEDGFYTKKLSDDFGINTIIPNVFDRNRLHDIIFTELTQGIVTPLSKQFFTDMCLNLMNRDNVAGIILGCTELSMLNKDNALPISIVDTVTPHVESAISFAFQQNRLIGKEARYEYI